MRRFSHLNGPRAGLLAAVAAAVVVLLVVLLSSGSGHAEGTVTTAGGAGTATQPGANEVRLTATTALSPAHVPSMSVGAPLPVQPVASGFLGLSLEYYVLSEYAGTDPSAPDPVFLQLIRNLNPGQRPVLRVGGDSTDWSWLPTAGVHPVGGFKVEITPQLVKILTAITQRLNAQLVLGIDLEDDSTALADHEAATLIDAVGADHVTALELGNEPELYDALGWYADAGKAVLGRARPYTLDDYESDFDRLGAHLPHVGLAGPASGSVKFSPPAALAQFIDGARGLSLVTVHTYPMQTCGTRPGLSSYPTIAKLLSPTSTLGLVQALASDVAAAHASHKRIRVDETDSVSCFGAPGVSNTYASALWSVETGLQYARAGVDGINLPTVPDAEYRLWTMHRSSATVAPQYYGLLDVADAVPAGSRFLATPDTGANPQTFAVRTPSGQIRVIVVNTGPAEKLAVHIPGASGPATATVLEGSGLAATSGVTLAGQRFAAPSSSGQLTGTASGVAVDPVRGDYVLNLAAESATTLTFP